MLTKLAKRTQTSTEEQKKLCGPWHQAKSISLILAHADSKTQLLLWKTLKTQANWSQVSQIVNTVQEAIIGLSLIYACKNECPHQANTEPIYTTTMRIHARTPHSHSQVHPLLLAHNRGNFPPCIPLASSSSIKTGHDNKQAALASGTSNQALTGAWRIAMHQSDDTIH